MTVICLWNSDKIEEEVAEHAPVPNLMVKYGVYQDIDKSLPVSVICDRGFRRSEVSAITMSVTLLIIQRK